MSYYQSIDHYAGRKRPVIKEISPLVDGGENPIKRVESDGVDVESIIISDGHDMLSGRIALRREGNKNADEYPLIQGVNDHWYGQFTMGLPGLYYFQIRAWVDHFRTWRDGIKKKAEADALTEVDFAIGAALIEDAIRRAQSREADRLKLHLRVVRGENGLPPFGERVTRSLSDDLYHLMNEFGDRSLEVHSAEIPIMVDRKRAEFSTWYELFPRSTAGVPGEHGTLRDVVRQLPRISTMGFNVLYLPPIHPVGRKFRKGKNNTLESGPADPGSPWAIGGPEGGFKEIHPQLGTFDDFEYLRIEAEKQGLEIALDIAFQCSPDHPWVTEHPDWFKVRPDGTIQYAENPPKKYQDIYPINFETDDWQNLWKELKSVFEFWIERGIRIFRVDNPHTKSFQFWRWCLSDLKVKHPDLIFLAEAFTRPNIMYHLAKTGYTQSYTYFTWRNTKEEFHEYMTELYHTEVRNFFRPNFWPNTPDILPGHLVKGGRPAFASRALLAFTLSSNSGIYGPAFELMERTPLKENSEEYLNSEKYEIRLWDYDREGNLEHLLTRINFIRNDNPALQSNKNFYFHGIDNDMLFAYSKRTDDFSSVILVIVNLDPYWTQSGWIHLDHQALGLDPDRSFKVVDLLNANEYTWDGIHSYIEIDPTHTPGHVFRIEQEGIVG